MNLNAMVAIAGGLALFGFWLANAKSGLRGFLLVCAGCALILLDYEGQAYLKSLAAMVIAGVVLALFLVFLRVLVHARWKRGPHYRPPLEISGACRNCAQSAQLKRYRDEACPLAAASAEAQQYRG